jgi:hypothetical protein
MNVIHKSLLATALPLLAPLSLLASEVVLFEDGRSMPVASAERKGDMVLLELEGGGSITVPAHRVTNWEKLERKQADKQPVVPKRDAPWRREAGEFAELIGETAERHQLDPALLTAMAQVESAFDPRAVSHKGARGLLQLMPQTAERFGVEDVFNVSQNVDGGARYMKWLLERYEGRTDLALAGYNAGEAAVDQYGGVPPYSETQNYVSRVMENASRLSDGAATGTRKSRSGT